MGENFDWDFDTLKKKPSPSAVQQSTPQQQQQTTAPTTTTTTSSSAPPNETPKPEPQPEAQKAANNGNQPAAHPQKPSALTSVIYPVLSKVKRNTNNFMS